MTFAEELKQLSEKVDLQHKLHRQLAEIKTKMRTAASSGYKSFKIDIITLNTKASAIYLPEADAENYYSIYTINEAFYVSEITKFLTELGFEASKIAYVRTNTLIDGYSSMIIYILFGKEALWLAF